MPQIESGDVQEFLLWLRSQGVNVHREQVPVSTLLPTQLELNKDKVQGMIANAPEASLGKIILVARDDYILDGHHRWFALTVKNPKYQIPIWRINLPIRVLLTRAREFYKASFKHAHESQAAAVLAG